MFTESKALFLYSVSPVHLGAGTAVGGLIDNPIQRERHTNHPIFAGSGIKGALRHRFSGEWKKEDLAVVFGPESSGSDHAGAVSFGDAQLVIFPVRSLKNGFIYATCPTALARAKRQLEISGITVEWTIPEVSGDEALICNLRTDEVISLEVFQFTAKENEMTKKIAEWLAANGVPSNESNQYFSEKLRSDLVLLSDTDFGYFVEHATSVEPHVRIDDKTGTAVPGGLFYSENLPPESLLLTTLMASDSRKEGSSMKKAAEVVNKLTKEIDNQMVQIGGDSTTGRGQILFHSVEVEVEAAAGEK